MRCKSIGHFWAHTCVKMLVQAGVTTFVTDGNANSYSNASNSPVENLQKYFISG